ncbi:MAG: hypothetical protein R3C14_15545 [Caldilineaceae bacterium]
MTTGLLPPLLLCLHVVRRRVMFWSNRVAKAAVNVARIEKCKQPVQ